MSVEELVGLIFEMVGTVAFAISGAMVAKRVDVFGVVVLSAMTALGGGIVRDILIGHLPPTMFSDYRYVMVAVITSVIVFIVAYIFRESYQKSEKTVDAVNNIFDALGLGVFTVMGAKVAIESGFTVNGILVVCLAVVTGVGGGLIRDVMLMEIPFVLKNGRNSDIYAVNICRRFDSRRNGISFDVYSRRKCQNFFRYRRYCCVRRENPRNDFQVGSPKGQVPEGAEIKLQGCRICVQTALSFIMFVIPWDNDFLRFLRPLLHRRSDSRQSSPHTILCQIHTVPSRRGCIFLPYQDQARFFA